MPGAALHVSCAFLPESHRAYPITIIIASIVGGALSLAVAAIFAYSARITWVPLLVSYAIGALLGAAFL